MKINKIIFSLPLFILFTSNMIGQSYYSADPYYLLETEKELFDNNFEYIPLLFRPVSNSNFQLRKWFFKARSEIYYNTNAPNLENTSDKWIGKGVSFFSSVHIAYKDKYFSFSAEPYYFINENKEYNEPNRSSIFTVLNDSQAHAQTPYTTYGLREVQVYANYKEFGVGWSNANMWWGSGMHTSSSMTSNTSGFGHLFIGTLEEKRYKNWGFTGRYIFSKFDEKSLYKPYFVAALLGVTYYTDPIISIGFAREALLGGEHESVQKDNIGALDAALSIFKGILIPDNIEQYREDWSYDDHAGTLFSSLIFEKAKLVLFFEIGRTDLASSLWSILVYPDHATATNIGMRKYGLFENDNLFFGIEYFQNRTTGKANKYQAGNWYERKQYEYSSYNGRRWAAHSGSDSDDFLISFGWMSETFTLIPSFNYERHGLTQTTSEIDGIPNDIYYLWPETKLEFRLDMRYSYKNYRFNFYYEYEDLLNLESTNKTRTGQVYWFGVERDLTDILQ